MLKLVSLIASASRFKQKSGIRWDNRLGHEPVRGKYTVIEMDYDAEDEENESNPSAKRQKVEEEEEEIPESQLSTKVQDLVTMIFNTNLMKQYLVEMEFDIEKSPLGASFSCIM